MKKMNVAATKEVRGGIFAPSFSLTPSLSLTANVGSANQS